MWADTRGRPNWPLPDSEIRVSLPSISSLTQSGVVELAARLGFLQHEGRLTVQPAHCELPLPQFLESCGAREGVWLLGLGCRQYARVATCLTAPCGRMQVKEESKRIHARNMQAGCGRERTGDGWQAEQTGAPWKQARRAPGSPGSVYVKERSMRPRRSNCAPCSSCACC